MFLSSSTSTAQARLLCYDIREANFHAFGRAEGVISAASPLVDFCVCEPRGAGRLPQQAHGGVWRDQQGLEAWRKGHHVHVQQVNASVHLWKTKDNTLVLVYATTVISSFFHCPPLGNKSKHTLFTLLLCLLIFFFHCEVTLHAARCISLCFNLGRRLYSTKCSLA